VPLVRKLIAAHPEVPARLLIGDDPVGINPKLNNIVKGWVAAKYPWIVMADSNVLCRATIFYVFSKLGERIAVW
jgi:ceramide glucosyltransferase